MYRDIIQSYVDYVTKKYGDATVVFDGYRGSSTKDMTHQRRSKTKEGTAITFELDMQLMSPKDQFLANKENKQRFIQFLGRELSKKNIPVYHAAGDADLLIVTTAVELAKNKATVVIGDDTDLLILLCHHAESDGHNIYMSPEPKKGATKIRIWDILHLKKRLGAALCKNILFLHAYLGSDTTSHIHGIGKGAALKKYEGMRKDAEVFMSSNSPKEQIIHAGEKVMLHLHSAKREIKLDRLRHKCFCEKVASSTVFISPQSLPPSSGATKYHSLRVYLQVHSWMGEDLIPEEWGWTKHDGEYTPKTMDLEAAPLNLLNVIHCNCHGDCSGTRCTCRKYGMRCSPSCGNCRGGGCTNSDEMILEDDETLAY